MCGEAIAASASPRVAHAHPACGNGVAWAIEHRRAERATILKPTGQSPGY